MDEFNKTKLTDQVKCRLKQITDIQNYFHQEVNQKRLCSEKLNKYVAAFDYIDKIVIVLIATSGGVSVISFTSVVGATVRMASTSSFTLIFSLTTGIIKKLLSITRNKKEKT